MRRAAAVAACMALLAMLAAFAQLGQAEPGSQYEPIVLKLRVHLMESSVRELQGKRSVESGQVTQRMGHINKAFAAAGIRWVLDQQRDHRVVNTSAWKRATRTKEKADRVSAFRSLMDRSDLLNPRGFDLFVGRDLRESGVQGVYLCPMVAGQRIGVAFISNEHGNGNTLASRKWAHELGHALGLRHTECDPAHADSLMMSGKCEHAKPFRKGLSAQEISTIRDNAQRGRPFCKG